MYNVSIFRGYKHSMVTGKNVKKETSVHGLGILIKYVISC